MPSLAHVLLSLAQEHTLLDNVELDQLLSFITITSHVKDAILAAQPPNHNPRIPPPVLPQHISTHIATTTGIPHRFIGTLWVTTCTVIWAKSHDVCSISADDYTTWSGAASVNLCALLADCMCIHCAYTFQPLSCSGHLTTCV